MIGRGVVMRLSTPKVAADDWQRLSHKTLNPHDVALRQEEGRLQSDVAMT